VRAHKFITYGYRLGPAKQLTKVHRSHPLAAQMRTVKGFRYCSEAAPLFPLAVKLPCPSVERVPPCDVTIHCDIFSGGLEEVLSEGGEVTRLACTVGGGGGGLGNQRSPSAVFAVWLWRACWTPWGFWGYAHPDVAPLEAAA